MNVHLRCCLFDRSQDVSVVEGVKVARQAALHTNFTSAPIPRITRVVLDCFERVKVRVRLARSPAEGAETATHKADVGEIDIAIDYISDQVTNYFPSDLIGCKYQRFKFLTRGCRER